MAQVPPDLTLGVIDAPARVYFKMDKSCPLAVALSDETGWPIVAVTDFHDVQDGLASGLHAMHFAVRTPTGMLLDIDGPHHEGKLLMQYHSTCVFGRGACGTMTREQALRWYQDQQGREAPVELTEYFVRPLLEKHFVHHESHGRLDRAWGK